jgi:hypothetical protein
LRNLNKDDVSCFYTIIYHATSFLQERKKINFWNLDEEKLLRTLEGLEEKYFYFHLIHYKNFFCIIKYNFLYLNNLTCALTHIDSTYKYIHNGFSCCSCMYTCMPSLSWWLATFLKFVSALFVINL